jgi:hypothetical protein
MTIGRNFNIKTNYDRSVDKETQTNNDIKIKDVWGFPKTEWGLAFIVLSNYMNFFDNRSKLVISTCVTRPNFISTFNNKSANQCNERELKDEVLRQLRISFPNLPEPFHIIINPNVKKINNTWNEPDTAFIQTYNNTFLKFESDITKNLYQVGTQNGNCKYHFTTIESAVTNSIVFANKIEPETSKIITKTNFIELNDIIRIVLIIIIFVILFKSLNKHSD